MSPLVLANGQQTHVWISQEALKVLPQGELKSILQEPEAFSALINGSMFPDGGYAVGDGYGEMAHWEPYQRLLGAAVVEQFPDLSEPAAAPYLAFLLGMASHGMADQVFDAHFQLASQTYDRDLGWSQGESMDEATDVEHCVVRRSTPAPEQWMPLELLMPLFVESGHVVDEATVVRGQDLLAVALYFVENAALNPDAVAEYRASFPWATTELYNPKTSGTPPYEAQIIATYWTRLWDELNGRPTPGHRVLGTWPVEGSYEVERNHEALESVLSVSFAAGMLRDDVVEGLVTAEDSDGRIIPVDLNLFYGNSSNVVRVIPLEDWSEDREHTVRVHAGLDFIDGGVSSEEFVLKFHTGVASVEEGCSCAHSQASRSRTVAGALALFSIGLALRRRS